MKNVIITCTTDNRKWLYDLTNPSKEKYSKLFNYDYVFTTEKYYDKEYKPGWNKIPFILENLEKYDYVVWMDDDAGFVKYDENILLKAITEMKEKSLFICKDFNGLNSGIMIIKSNDFSKFLFETIWNNRKFYKNDSHGNPGNMEQPAIIDMCKIYTDDVFIGDGKIYNSYDKRYSKYEINQRNENSYIVHIAAGGKWKERNKDIIKKIFI